MEPITLNLDLGQWAPYGWLAAYVLVAAFLGGISRRHIRLYGVTTGDVQSAHFTTFVMSGLLGCVVFIATFCFTNGMFKRSIELANRNVEVDSPALVEERVRVSENQPPALAEITVQAKRALCERLIAQQCDEMLPNERHKHKNVGNSP